MPNHCTNLVTIVGAPAELERAVTLLRGRSPIYTLSETERRILGESKEEPETPFQFHKIIPVPDEVLKAGYDRAGYNWQTDNWGTKWDAYDFDKDLLECYEPGKSIRITYKFDTAWAPPIPILKALAKRFPELRIYHSYGEEYPTRGRSCFRDGTTFHKHDRPPVEKSFEHIFYTGLWDRWQEALLAGHPEWVGEQEKLWHEKRLTGEAQDLTIVRS